MVDSVLATALFYSVTLVCGMTLFILGYRLFSLLPAPGPSPSPGAPAPATPDATGAVIDGRVANWSFTFKNIAPGTAFALFGAGVVVVGLLNGPHAIKRATDDAEKQAQLQADGKKAEAEKARHELEVVALKARDGGAAAQTKTVPVSAPFSTPPNFSASSLRDEQRRLEEAAKRLQHINALLDAFRKLVEQKPLSPTEQNLLHEWFKGQPPLTRTTDV